MLIYDDMENLSCGLEQVHDDVGHAIVEIVRVKDRFAAPTEGGWSDVLMNLRFVTGKGHAPLLPFELQLVHRKMLVLRHDLGGHDAYAAYRFASEVVELCAVAEANSQTEVVAWSS